MEQTRDPINRHTHIHMLEHLIYGAATIEYPCGKKKLETNLKPYAEPILGKFKT